MAIGLQLDGRRRAVRSQVPEVAGASTGRHHPVVPSVQLALTDKAIAERLRLALSEEPAFQGWRVQCAGAAPDVEQPGVLVLDAAARDRLPARIPHPERVVLIARRDPQELERAWQAGIVSVVYQDEPWSTVMLAVLAARFRVAGRPL